MKSTSKTGERLWNGTPSPKGTNRSEKCRFRAPAELRWALEDISGQRSRAWPRTGVYGQGPRRLASDVLGHEVSAELVVPVAGWHRSLWPGADS